MARFTAFLPMAARCNGSKAWASPRASPSTRAAASTSAIAAARFSRSARSAKFLCSRRSSPRSPPITWRSVRRASFSSPGPRHRAYDRVFRISPAGEVSVFFRGLGRPQGLAFDRLGISMSRDRSAASAASCASHPQAEAEVVLGGSNIVGLALLPTHRAMIATNSALFTLDWDVEGLPLNG